MKFNDLSERYKDAVHRHIEEHLGGDRHGVDIASKWRISVVMGLIANGKLVFVGGPDAPALDKPEGPNAE